MDSGAGHLPAVDGDESSSGRPAEKLTGVALTRQPVHAILNQPERLRIRARHRAPLRWSARIPRTLVKLRSLSHPNFTNSNSISGQGKLGDEPPVRAPLKAAGSPETRCTGDGTERPQGPADRRTPTLKHG